MKIILLIFLRLANKIKRVVANSEDKAYDIDNLKCDEPFNNYVEIVQNKSSNEGKIAEADENYQTARNRLNAKVFQFNEDKYRNILENGDGQKLWSEINWTRQYKELTRQQIPIQVMSNYLEQLYQPLDINEKDGMNDQHSNMYIPITDDPLTENELYSASIKMKKGGYDFTLAALILQDSRQSS